MRFPDSFFEDEVRDGFYVPALMKRAWAAQMEVLADVAGICKRHGIRWFADRGTLLGAVRHQGYIPWDDDLDICMLRDDFNRFMAVAERELPEGYFIPKNRGDDQRLLTSVLYGAPFCLEENHRGKFHGFPFRTGLDIFVLDYVAPDPEDEDLRVQLALIVWSAAKEIHEGNQNTPQSQEILAGLEDLFQVTFDRKAPVKEQLYVLLENLFSMYTPPEGTLPLPQAQVAFMPNWLRGRTWGFPLDVYRSSVLLPFEHMEMAVPADYRKALEIQFGPHYRTPWRAGGGHEYPSYQALENHLAEVSRGQFNFLARYWLPEGEPGR